MFALVEDGKITQMPKGSKGITIGDNQYPASIFTSIYSEEERNAVGIYTVEIDETNKNSSIGRSFSLCSAFARQGLITSEISFLWDRNF